MVTLHLNSLLSLGFNSSWRPSSLTEFAQPFHGSMQTKLSASCCQSTPLEKTLSSKLTVTLWPLPASVSYIGLLTPVSRRMESALPSLRVSVIVSGAAGCSPLALSLQVAASMAKETLSSLVTPK